MLTADPSHSNVSAALSSSVYASLIVTKAAATVAKRVGTRAVQCPSKSQDGICYNDVIKQRWRCIEPTENVVFLFTHYNLVALLPNLPNNANLVFFILLYNTSPPYAIFVNNHFQTYVGYIGKAALVTCWRLSLH